LARNETADLARSFGGRLFTELTLDALVSDVLAEEGFREEI